MDAAVVFFFQVDALDFRSEARQFIESIFKGLEILDCRMGPAFTRYDAEDAWRIGQRPFEGDTAFDFIEGHQFSLTADKGVLCILGPHSVFREILAAEKFLLQVLDVPCLIEIVHFLAKLADCIAGIAVRMRVVDAEKDFLHGYIVIDEAFEADQLGHEKAHLILIFSRCQ